MHMASGRHTDKYSELQYRRMWLRQLQAEFRQICSSYRISLNAPAFRIGDSSTTLGSWHPETRTISISSILINQYSWDAVINILKHEMAHQYVHECLDAGMELPHGPSFMAACEKLGLAYPFNAAAGDTPRVFVATGQHGFAPEYDRKINRVKKILSLAGSGNKHEAAAAMSKANSLIRKYNLERLTSSSPARYSYEIINTGKKRLPIIERQIASLLMDYFFVDIVYSELYDPHRAESLKTIELLGTIDNVAFAKHVYDFLNRRLEFLWQNYRKSSGSPGKLRKTFILGLLHGVRDKLAKEESRKKWSAEITTGTKTCKTISGLVVAKDAGLAGFTTRRFPRLRKVHYRASAIYCAKAFSDGKTAGQKITIHKTIRHADGNLGKLIGRQ